VTKLESRHFIEHFLVRPGKSISLRKDFDPGYTADDLRREDADILLQQDIERLAELQDKLYAQQTHALLVIIQAMDAGGKDSVIKHVMSGLNPQGCQVFSFKEPSTEELQHDYLWRASKALPRRGLICIFNRSYYEEVLVVRVHPHLLDLQRLPPEVVKGDIWSRRFDQINAFEQYLHDNGITVLKFFLHLSLGEQKRRFLERIERPEKNWKFSASDVRERRHWEAYMDAYEQMLSHTSTSAAPWYVVPADHKWFTRLGVAAVIASALEGLNPNYPTVTDEQRQELAQAATLLELEPD
jgi:PPK2 family polyphosphate:nucleotide phosphotransferase